ncbi:hypothetical protein QBC43DRAFT_372232 [Cladorrhinum sp. PSN259]|nr:hypothetical protein QBC43DRAFT_372232 [Cladorrhinum sp. PSN259]
MYSTRPATLGRTLSPLNLNVPDDDYRRDVDTSKIVIEAPNTQLLNLPESCDKFRILIIGKAGVGKSTICSKVFGIPPEKAGVSHYSVGTAKEKVWHPLTFDGDNENLIMHDSGGFEAGDLDCVDAITKFINFRKSQHRLADQLHCIWYCISCNSNRPIQEAELQFFQKADVGNIPVVVVFTQFDKLVDAAFMKELLRSMSKGNMQPDLPHLRELAHNAAVAQYEKNYRGQFERTFGRRSRVTITRIGIRPDEDDDSGSVSGVDTLVQETREILLEDGLKLLWAAAQAHSADMKLQASVDAGMATFWRAVGLGSVPFVPFVSAAGLYNSFNKILATVDTVWRIPGCTKLIEKTKMRNRILQGCFDVNVFDRIGAQFLISLNIFGPLSGGQTAMVLLKLIAGISLLYESIFWEYKSHAGRAGVGKEEMEALITKFQESDGRARMANHLTGTISTSNAFNKEACMKELRKAIDEGRNEKGKSLIRKHTVVPGE